MKLIYTIITCILITAAVISGCANKEEAAKPAETPAQQKAASPAPPPDPQQSAPDPGSTSTQGPRPVTVLSALPELVAGEIIEIKGKTRPGSRVFINGQEADLNAMGEFVFPFNLQVGKNDIKVVTLGKNKVEDTRTLTIERKPVPPRLTVITPDRSEVENLVISGQTEKGCVVYVNTSIARPDRDGNFTSAVQLKEGLNKIKVTSTNRDGGTASVEKTVAFTPPTPRLEVIIPEDTRSKQVTVSGLTDTNTVLLIYVNDVKTEVNMSNGIFSGVISLEEGVNSVTVTAVNKWGKRTTVSRNVSYLTF